MYRCNRCRRLSTECRILSSFTANVILLGIYLIRDTHKEEVHFSDAWPSTPKRFQSFSDTAFDGAVDLVRKRGHSHNDYWQDCPLSSAIGHGFRSVEVDVFPKGKKLMVGHTRFELEPEKTLDRMYLNPLVEMLTYGDKHDAERPGEGGLQCGLTGVSGRRVRGSRGMTFGSESASVLGDESLTLLVDLKADPDESVALLHHALTPLRPLLTKVDQNGELKRGVVTVLVSGNRPSVENLFAPSDESGAGHGNLGTIPERYIFIDGRSKDIADNMDTALVPVVSLSWRSMRLARMFGREEQYMKQMSEHAHAQGKLLRIWGAPNAEGVWQKIIRSNVDYISIDDHEKYIHFARRFNFL